MSDGYWYVASPYSKYHAGIMAAYSATLREVVRLVKSGASVFSPIIHSHPIAIRGGIDALDVNFWVSFDRPMMETAKGCIVLQLDGWDKSTGVAHEIEYFRKAGKPVVFMERGNVPEIM